MKSARRSLSSGGIFDWDQSLERISELNALAEDPNLWNNPENAQKLMRERTRLTNAIDGYRALENGLEDAVGLVDLAEEEGDQETIEAAEADIAALQEKAEQARLESLLSGEADPNDAYLEIHAGSGGTEAQDWAQMMARMYTRWAEQHGYKVELLEEHPGEEAGIKSVTLRINGDNAYGWLKTESGVHRLVRISPFDSQARRHTSFSSAWVYPSSTIRLRSRSRKKTCGSTPTAQAAPVAST